MREQTLDNPDDFLVIDSQKFDQIQRVHFPGLAQNLQNPFTQIARHFVAKFREE